MCSVAPRPLSRSTQTLGVASGTYAPSARHVRPPDNGMGVRFRQGENGPGLKKLATESHKGERALLAYQPCPMTGEPEGGA
jgi:hypothetical protein